MSRQNKRKTNLQRQTTDWWLSERKGRGGVEKDKGPQGMALKTRL